ncbi:hypothetical protein [Taibaiella koreensis]|uniref:hypothetical protein n=1 Tax=Taibaiella koreensis TaxID=1268548 RepID=UPI000E59AFD8|nr:hypothetical protein [Taibaiella koreensis]
MNNSIHIPKPCHENWDNMLREEQGRHCLSCCKTVVDFSTWDNESILAYLQNKNGERVCGRFNAEQVASVPAPSQQELLQGVFRSAMPLLRKIAAVIVLYFGLGSVQETHAQKVVGKIKVTQQPQQQLLGEPAVMQPADTAKPQAVPQVDTFKPQIMGMIRMPDPAPKNQPKKKVSTTAKKPTR